VHRTDNLTAICELTVYTKCGGLNVSQPYGPSWSVTGITLLFYISTYNTVQQGYIAQFMGEVKMSTSDVIILLVLTTVLKSIKKQKKIELGTRKASANV
jgi:hypothetical protein